MSTNTSTTTAATRPPVEIHPTAHLDPGAYVRGTHAISLGAGVLVHPRAMLASIHGPLIINDGAVIMEKSIIGGPIPTGTGSSDKTPGHGPAETDTVLDGNADGNEDDDQDPLKTVIGANALISAHAQIHAGAAVGEAVIVETGVVVGKGVCVGAHSKICAGVVIGEGGKVDSEMVIGEWEVVLGGYTGAGQRRRRRKRMDVGGVEVARIKAMQRDREATAVVLRSAARAPVLRKK